jgi:hypothetical protein
MGDTSQKRTRTREGWTDEQKQAARERETQRRAQLQQQADDDVPRVPSGFVAFPSWMLPDRSISDLGKWVILALSLYASRDGLCWPTAATIAHTLNRSERTVFRGLNEVVALGLVSVVPRYRNGAQISSVYQLEFSRWGSIKPPPDKNVIPGESKLSSQGCQNRHAEQDLKTGSTQQVDPPYPPTGGKTERAPRAAVAKKAGEPEPHGTRGPRPRMVALRDELLKRIDASRKVDGSEVIDPYLRDNDPWLGERLAEGWQLGDLLATAQHYADQLGEFARATGYNVTPDGLVKSAVERQRALRERRGKVADELAVEVQNAFASGALRAEWREHVSRALRPNRL